MNLVKDLSLITSISRVRARGGSSLNSLTLANRPTDQVKTQSARWFKATTHRKRGPKHCTLWSERHANRVTGSVNCKTRNR